MDIQTDQVIMQSNYQNREISPVFVGFALFALNSIALYQAFPGENFGQVLIALAFLTARAFSASYVHDIATNLNLDKK